MLERPIICCKLTTEKPIYPKDPEKVTLKAACLLITHMVLLQDIQVDLLVTDERVNLSSVCRISPPDTFTTSLTAESAVWPLSFSGHYFP